MRLCPFRLPAETARRRSRRGSPLLAVRRGRVRRRSRTGLSAACRSPPPPAALLPRPRPRIPARAPASAAAVVAGGTPTAATTTGTPPCVAPPRTPTSSGTPAGTPARTDTGAVIPGGDLKGAALRPTHRRTLSTHAHAPCPGRARAGGPRALVLAAAAAELLLHVLEDVDAAVGIHLELSPNRGEDEASDGRLIVDHRREIPATPAQRASGRHGKGTFRLGTKCYQTHCWYSNGRSVYAPLAAFLRFTHGVRRLLCLVAACLVVSQTCPALQGH